MIDDRFIYNYRLTSMKVLREYMRDEIINDNRNDYVELIPDTKNKDVGIDKQDFENSNKILFIKNYPMLFNIYNTLRPNHNHMSYVFKDDDYIVLFTKVSNQFPFLMVRLKSQGNSLCKNIEVAYDFPTRNIFKRDTGIRNKFDIILESNENLQYIVKVYSNGSVQEENIIPISNGRDRMIINDLVGVEIESPFHIFLMNMFVLMIKEELQKDRIFWFETVDTNTRTFLVIEEDNSMKLKLVHQRLIESFTLATTSDPLHKDPSVKNAVYRFEGYQQSYKLPYPKLMDTKTKIYYVLTQWNDVFFFFKILAPNDLDFSGRTFGMIFKNCNSIVEGFKLVKAKLDDIKLCGIN